MSFWVLGPWKTCQASNTPVQMQVLLPAPSAPTYHDKSNSVVSTPLQGKSLPQRPTQWLLKLKVKGPPKPSDLNDLGSGPSTFGMMPLLQRKGSRSGCDSPHPGTLTLAT